MSGDTSGLDKAIGGSKTPNVTAFLSFYLYSLMMLLIGLIVQPIQEPISNWSYSTTRQNIEGLQVVTLRRQADVKSGWYVYSSNNNSEIVGSPTALSLLSSTYYSAYGKLESIGAIQRYEPVFLENMVVSEVC